MSHGFLPPTLALSLQEAASKHGIRRVVKPLLGGAHSHGGAHQRCQWKNAAHVPLGHWPDHGSLWEITGVPQWGEMLSYSNHRGLLSRRGQDSIPDLGQGSTSSWRPPPHGRIIRGEQMQLTWSCPAHGAGRQAASSGQSSRAIRKRRRGLQEGRGCADLVLFGVPAGKTEVPVPPPPSLRLRTHGVSPGTKEHWLQLAWLGKGLLFWPFLPLWRKCHISGGGRKHPPHPDPSAKPRKQ